LSWSLPARFLSTALVALVITVAGVPASSPPAVAADPSAGAPSASSLPGPAPTCTPEIEPNDRPEDAPRMASAVCLTGLLPELRDQDLVLWDVLPAEALITWRITVEGVPTTITSVHLFNILTEPDVYPIDAREFMRVDSDATSDVPGVASGVSLKAGRYLLGISRGYPADRNPDPPGGYRVMIEREQPLPADGDVEPNDDAASATPVGNPIALTGDSFDRNIDLYRWTITPEDAMSRWQLDVRGVVGDYLALRLMGPDGAVLATADMPRDGAAHLYDLQLSPGDYLIEMLSTTDGSLPYVLTSQPSTDPRADGEPNDEPARALPIEIGQEVTGRLAGPRDFDYYRFSVPQTLAATQYDVALRVGTAQDRRVCLIGPDLLEIQCRQGQGDVVLSNLSLVGGDHSIHVSGDEDLADDYRLSVTDAGLVVADREVEPNDSTITASPFDPSIVMRGRSANNDEDHFRVTIKGDPQVWRLDAAGTAIRSLLWLEPDLELRGTADIAPDGSAASLWDMYLVPGEHWFTIETEGEDYALTLTPLGPQPPDTEREPNNDTANAEPIDVGEPRIGRVPGPADADLFRFSLEAPSHVVMRLAPPPDGAIRVRLSTGGTELMRTRDPLPGKPFVYDAFLQTGDYEVMLTSESGSIAPYTLIVDRADPWMLPIDLEPNDMVEAARDLPASLVIEGTGWGRDAEDADWYRIPAPPDPTQPLVVAIEGAITRVELTDGTSQIGIDPDAERTTWASRALPAGMPLYLHVASGGDYRITVSGGGLVPAPALGTDPLDITLAMDATDVSAYELFGQRVGGSLSIVNGGTAAVDVALDALTSDDRWSVDLSAVAATIPARGSLDVPLSVVVPPDAWTDVPTRVSIRALSGDDGQATTFVDILPGRDSTPVGAEQSWPLPVELLGGLDAASLALGATITDPTFTEASLLSLHDGLALAGAGFSGSLSGAPALFTMDLATDDPVPVAGLIIDPLAGTPSLAATPRRFALELSDDGTTWDPVLSGELTPRQEDQAFVLEAPVLARFARLTIHTTWSGDRSSLQMGEWQVIATPGWAPVTPLNVADPRHGGHIVFTQPGPSDPRQLEGMLDEEQLTDAWEPYLEPDSTFTWVVGFRDGRAPQVSELQWVDPAGSDPAQRFERVQVEIGTGSPLGPWEDAGIWQLTRAADGSVPAFRFDEPTWARYVRISGDGPAETKGYWETPATFRVLERPTDDTYRSIVGAWGRNRPDAIRESLEPPDLSNAAARATIGPDGDDTPGAATPLTIDVPYDGRIQRGVDVDWYQLTVPAGQNVLELSLAAPSAAGIVAALQDATGADVPLTESTSSEPGVLRFVADVEPGATYRVRLEQPPFSTVFSYDTSGSMGSYLTYISTAMRGFAADVTPGEEAVMIMPFEDPPLLEDWSDDPWTIEDAVAGVFSVSGSSAAETSLLSALKELAARPGARAILAVTDAETSSYGQMGDLWRDLGAIKPVVFTVHVGGGGAPQLTTNLMQDWAHSWGGHYEYASSHGHIDRAFDRLATWMRRPAAYTIGFGATFVDHTPGRLVISAPSGPDGDQSVVAGSGVAVEILLDTSGSMRAKVGKKQRIAIAKAVLRNLVEETLPAGLPVALRTFDPQRQCGSTLLAPLAPLDKATMSALVRDLKIVKTTKTPLAATLAEVAADLAGVDGPKIIVLVTDGQESCDGDPEQVIRDLVAQGLDVRVNIVGFALDDVDLKADLQRWAEVGNGQAFDAQGAEELAAGIVTALRAPFQVYDDHDTLIASGVVGGEAVVLSPGIYRVEVLTDPVMVFEDVTISAGQSRTLQLEAPAATP
jgi:hypothetical protein